MLPFSVNIFLYVRSLLAFFGIFIQILLRCKNMVLMKALHCLEQKVPLSLHLVFVDNIQHSKRRNYVLEQLPLFYLCFFAYSELF